MKKEKMLHYNTNTGKLEKCGAKQGRCPFGSENHFPESKLKEAQAYTDEMNKKLAEEEKSRKIANPCPLTTHIKGESNRLKEEKDTSHLDWRAGEHGMELKRLKSTIGHSPFDPTKLPDTNMTRLEATIIDLAISEHRPIPQKKELKGKHYSSREEAMRDVERHNQNQTESKENSKSYTPINKETEPLYSDEDRKREISAKYKNIKDPIDKKVEQIRDLKTLVDNTGEEVSKINWNNIRVEDNKIICGEDWKLYDLTAENPTQGVISGINSVPENIRRRVFDIAEEYFKEKSCIFDNE